MKKGAIIFSVLLFLAGAGLLLVIQNHRTDKSAVYVETGSGTDYDCQAVNIKEEAYLFFWMKDGNKCKAVRIDEGKASYDVLGTVVFSEIYYQYRYQKKNGTWMYGIGVCNPENTKKKVVTEWEVSPGEWLAFGGMKEQKKLLYVVMNEEGEITEYETDVDKEELKWQVTRNIRAGENQQIYGVRYDNAGSLTVAVSAYEGYTYSYNNTVPQSVNWEEAIGSKKEADSHVQQKVKQKIMWIAIKTGLSLYLVLAIILFILLLGINHKQSLIVRMYSIAEMIVILLILICSVVWKNHIDVQIAENYIKKAEMLQTVGTEYIKKASDFSEVLVYDAEGNKLISTAEMPLDGNGKDYYGEELEQLLKESKDSKKSEYAFLWKNGMETVAVSMYDWRNVGTEEIVVAVVDEQAMEQEKAENYQELKVLMTILFVTSSMLLAIFGILYQYRWNYFLRKVQDASKKKEKCVIPGKNAGGMQAIWGVVQELTGNREQLQYEKDQSVMAYTRFAPGGMEKLFHKEGLNEVTTGSLEYSRGIMVKTTMDSFGEYEGSEYVSLVNKALMFMLSILKKKDGIMISCQTDYLATKNFFTGRADEAVNFAIETILSYQKEPVLKRQNKLFIVHGAEYCCGMAGTDERTMPFVYTRDDEILENYETVLRKAGIQIILTDAVLNRLEDKHFQIRCIGYVTDKKHKSSLKLYECLDAYSEGKRKQILQTMPLFEKALELFYSDDFYLARNTFNEVLQGNPRDQIARWYLFNCEYYLNANGNEEVVYGLYENPMLEQQYQI